ncbi:helix-turn-helix transcriptional regulator [Archangium sp.]|jgi:transcriptional regulator with XRE-family HTH domain|uniref:helix-turn-helix transcriptional regulator n=1 Tax=Archangium sp. TaxID=1872627 RepID=UPI002ED9AAA2
MTDRQNRREWLAAHLGQVLREARQRAALTQADVAERIGVVTEVFGRLERGNLLPSVPTLRKLCRVLHVDANVMLGLEVEKAPSWMEAPEHEADEPPELRRLVRALRRMDAAQLAVVSSTAHALLRHTGQQPDDPSE